MNLFISFSGGKTSAYMTKWLLDNKKDDYKNIVVLFANTGQENEETLAFVDECDKKWGFNIVWLEAKVMHNKREGCSYTVVDYESASRKGEPFEQVIIKYGIPNTSYLHCTRELKLNPMLKYIKNIGWEKKDYKTAIGIRVDEMDRISFNSEKDGLIYPLCEENKQTKDSINRWWERQSFNLRLEEHQGNCKWCYKKSNRKLLTLAQDDASIFDFPKRMELQYGLNGSNKDGTRRVFFRGNKSTIFLLEESLQPFQRFTEKRNQNTDLFDMDMDSANGCSESCEVH